MWSRSLIVATIAVVAQGGTIEDTIPDSRYREYGDTFRLHTCQIFGTNTDGEMQLGSCTVIGEKWALTAAHVVASMTECSVISDSGVYQIDQVYTHILYAGVSAEHDIALVRVAKSFPIRWFPPLSDGSEKAGEVATAVGYGVTGTLSAGYTKGDNQIRAGTQLLASRERSVWICQIRRKDTSLPFCIAPGDSGGPLWARAADGRTVLVGVNSYTAKVGTGLKSRAGEESGHTRVAMYLDWIAEVTAE